MIDDATEEAKPTDDDEIVETARERRKLCDEAENQNRIDAQEDLKFYTGGENQWDPAAAAKRKSEGRPMITVNTLPTFVRQVTNDQRQNTPSIKIHPVDDAADVDSAKVRQGLIRHIEYDSNADVATDRAVNSAAQIGFGYWRLVTEYESDTSFNQKIMYKSIRNALSVRIDPLSVEPDGSDMGYAFVDFLMDREEFKRQYPDAKAGNADVANETTYAGWFVGTSVIISDYYTIDRDDDKAVLLDDGSTGLKSELPKEFHGKIVKERDTTRRKVMLHKITGCDVLESTEIKCKWIPVFPVYGDEVDIEGKVYRWGIIRNAKGPAQSYNVMMTAATEEVASRSKAPWVMAEGQEEGHEDEFEQSNVKQLPYLTYKMTELNGSLAPPPQRQPMADVPAGMLAMAMHARDNVKATTGLFDSSLGAKGTATSGIQEREQQAQGDMANFHFADGLLRSIRHCGRCINSMIPHYYDAQRTTRILGEDDSADYATINQPNVNQEPSEDGSIKAVLNDMTAGEYDCTVAAGPSYSTLRQESAERMGDLMAKNPELWAVFGDLYVSSQDWPNADKIAARVKKTIAPNLMDGEDKDKDKQAEPMVQTPQGPLALSHVPQAIQSLQEQIGQQAEQLKKAGADKQAADAARAQESLLKQQEVNVDQQLEPARQEVQKSELAVRAKEAEAKGIQAQADLERVRMEAQMMPDKVKIEADQMSRDAALAHEKATRAVIEANTPPEPEEPPLKLEDVAKLLEQFKAEPPKGMKIKAPSGQVYDVDLR